MADIFILASALYTEGIRFSENGKLRIFFPGIPSQKTLIPSPILILTDK
jgi:hypothetical protein